MVGFRVGLGETKENVKVEILGETTELSKIPWELAMWDELGEIRRPFSFETWAREHRTEELTYRLWVSANKLTRRCLELLGCCRDLHDCCMYLDGRIIAGTCRSREVGCVASYGTKYPCQSCRRA